MFHTKGVRWNAIAPTSFIITVVPAARDDISPDPCAN
jgi:hypothetical protein